MQTSSIEDTDADTSTARIYTGRANIDVLKEPDTTNLEIDRDEPTHLGGIRHAL